MLSCRDVGFHAYGLHACSLARHGPACVFRTRCPAELALTETSRYRGRLAIFPMTLQLYKAVHRVATVCKNMTESLFVQEVIIRMVGELFSRSHVQAQTERLQATTTR